MLDGTTPNTAPALRQSWPLVEEDSESRTDDEKCHEEGRVNRSLSNGLGFLDSICHKECHEGQEIERSVEENSGRP